MKKRTLLILIPVAAILSNGVAYLIVSHLRAPAKADAVAATGDLPVESASPRDLPGERRKQGSGFKDGEQDREERALARRSAGLAALDAGDYERALIDLTEARSLLGSKANVDELLRVTEDLRARQRSTLRAHPAPPPNPAVQRFGARPGARRVVVKEEPPAEAPPAPAPAPASGLVIVSTTPRGLLVHIDDAAVDLTPMRTRIKAGTHRVALFDGDRKVYETALDVREGGTATLLKDLSTERGPEPPLRESPRVAPPAPVASNNEAPPRPAVSGVAGAPAPRASRPSAAFPATPRPGLTTQTGSLEISSPGLYGVVWVNGRPRGYPPLEVSELERGPAKVEVRVNGIERRATTVQVAPGRTTAVKLR